MDWREVLERAHVECVPRGPHHVLVTLPSGAEAELRLVRSSRTLRPSWVLDHRAEWSNHRVLVLAPDASSQALAQVRAAGQSVVTDSGRVLLQVANELLDRSPAAAAPAKARRGPKPWGKLAVVRRLLEGAPLSQHELAVVAGVRQPLVSKTLSTLESAGLVRRGESGWEPSGWEDLFTGWRVAYPGPGGLVQHWYGLEPLPEQLARALAANPGRRVVLSGDLAADAIAPWQAPSRVLLYVAQPADLRVHGFVQSGAQEATLTITAPEDPGVFASPGPGVPEDIWAGTRAGGSLVELADPVQVLADLLAASPSSREAADLLTAELAHGDAGRQLRRWLHRRAGRVSAWT